MSWKERLEYAKALVKLSKKGQVTFGSAPSQVISLVLMGLVAAAGIIGLVAFRNSSSDAVANTSITNVVTGIGNFTAQLPTVGIMLGIGLILLVILGVFGFGRKGGL
jgi:hypothetical protein